MFKPLMDACEAAAAEPLRGITLDGQIQPNLFSIEASGASTGPILDAAKSLLGLLDSTPKAAVSFPLDAQERRTWFNIHPNIFRHGLLLEAASAAQRDAALAVIAASLSPRGYRQARDVKRLNGLLAEITGSSDQFGEWPYWFSLFGRPSADEPWAWQIDGHHLNVNCLVLDDRLVFTTSFMGSEPCHVHDGPLAGTAVFDAETRAGLEFLRALDDTQRSVAVLRSSIAPADLPAELNHPVDGRMQAGAFKDNAVIPFEGVRGGQLNAMQRVGLRDLVATYVGWADDGHAALTMRDVDAHLENTHFCWMGAQGDERLSAERVPGAESSDSGGVGSLREDEQDVAA